MRNVLTFLSNSKARFFELDEAVSEYGGLAWLKLGRLAIGKNFNRELFNYSPKQLLIEEYYSDGIKSY